MRHYHGSATISQGAAVVEGDCIIETVGGPAPGPDPAWLGNLEDLAPTVDLVEGRAWLRLADGRECEIHVEHAVAGSGLTEFSGAKGILDLHWQRKVKIRSDSCRAYLRAYLENAPGPRPAFRVDAAAATMDEQGIPQATNPESIADLEATLLELRDRLNKYLDLAADDLIAADEGFNFAGQLQATLADAVQHTASVRERLVEIQRKDSWVRGDPGAEPNA